MLSHSVLSSSIGNFIIESTHTDHRQGYRTASFNRDVPLNDVDEVLAFIKKNTDTLAVSNVELFLSHKQSSLTATHYHYQQYHQGLVVWQTEFIVSVEHSPSTTVRVFSNVYWVPAVNQQAIIKPVVSGMSAIEKSWNVLKANGQLYASPLAKLVYYPIGHQLVRVWIIDLLVSNPYGDWQHIVHADSGDTISLQRTDLPRQAIKTKGFHRGKWDFSQVTERQSSSFQKAYGEWTAKENFQQESLLVSADQLRVDGTAVVFDPDPRTALGNIYLFDSSPAVSFTNAYVTRTLKDITVSNGVYSLVGPWVKIVNFEAPNTVPSTSTNGYWNFRRGSSGFNDAMVYYHIDNSQRYLQGLGFTSDQGIQMASIAADTDARNGTDNSYYFPLRNRLAFGRGCVDDSEDPDIILHEYSHAIINSINNRFVGGDTGAIGEGIADYWAGSYRNSTTQGAMFYPHWVFVWDGHNLCSLGRQMNRTDYIYDAQQTYQAHGVVNGQNADELWSTPLFQTLLQVKRTGGRREEVDRIILESLFGRGSGLKMPDMAKAIINTAKVLYPSGQHAQIFEEKFREVSIIPEVLQATMLVDGLTDSSKILVGTETEFSIKLKNTSSATVTNVIAVLSRVSNGVEVKTSIARFNDIAPQQTEVSLSPVSVSLPANYDCGKNARFLLQAEYTQAASKQTQNIYLELPIGSHQQTIYAVTPSMMIPDNDSLGVSSSIQISETSMVTNLNQLLVHINVLHTYRGDLDIKLVSPQGTTTQLFRRDGDRRANLNTVFPSVEKPEQSFDQLKRESFDGRWTLSVKDTSKMNIGVLNSWSIERRNIVCNTPVVEPSTKKPEANEGGGGAITILVLWWLLGLVIYSKKTAVLPRVNSSIN